MCVPAAADGAAYVRWCGLLINSQTLELQADYTRCAAAAAPAAAGNARWPLASRG